MLDRALATSRIGDYRIEREIGRGGMGIVYAAQHVDSGELVALKLISPQLLTELRQRRRFLQETRAASQLHHPGLCRMLGHGEDESGQPYLVMEYLAGCSLRSALTHAPGRRLPSEVAVELAVQLSDALDSVHQAGFLHRDVKPSNVMLLDDPKQPIGWRVKLLDFGLAQLLQEGAATTFTEEGVPGTPAYMSPEQCEGQRRLDGRSDVYALGILLYEMTCGQTPFVGEPTRVMFQHVYEPPQAPRKLQPRLEPQLAELILQMLAKEPASRPTMPEVRARLLAQAASKEALAPATRPGYRAVHWIVGIGLLCLLGGMALGTQLRPLEEAANKVPERPVISPIMCEASCADGEQSLGSAIAPPALVQSAPPSRLKRARKTATPPVPPAAAQPGPAAAPPPAAEVKTPQPDRKVEFWD